MINFVPIPSKKLALLLVVLVVGLLLFAAYYFYQRSLESSQGEVFSLSPEEDLPYRGEDFTVTYSSEENLYLVHVTKAPYKDTKVKAENWVKRLINNDICSLNIAWWADKDILPKPLAETELTSTGCPKNSS